MRGPAQTFHPAEYICDELVHRGWTFYRAALEAGGDELDAAAIAMYCTVQKPGLLLGSVGEILARAFDVSPEHFSNLDAAWRAHPERSERFSVPAQLFSDFPFELAEQPAPPPISTGRT